MVIFLASKCQREYVSVIWTDGTTKKEVSNLGTNVDGTTLLNYTQGDVWKKVQMAPLKFIQWRENGRTYPAMTMNISRRFQVSARYVSLPHRPIAITLIIISIAKNAKIKWSKPARTCRKRENIQLMSAPALNP